MNKNVRKARKAKGDSEIDLKPMMNLFTVLIPFLLACASFASIKIMDIKLPETLQNVQQPQRKDAEDEGLLLTIFITDEGIKLGAKGAMLPTTFTREFHKYVYRYPAGSSNEETYLYPVTKANKKEMPLCPQDKSRRLTLFEREEIILYAVERQSEDDTGHVKMALYNQYDEVLTNVAGKIIEELPAVGDTVYVLSLSGRRSEVVVNPQNYTVREMTVYSELASRLLRIKAKYPDVPDQGEIKIVAEDDVVFDKLVHVMDICRDFGYPKISLAKLAG